MLDVGCWMFVVLVVKTSVHRRGAVMSPDMKLPLSAIRFILVPGRTMDTVCAAIGKAKNSSKIQRQPAARGRDRPHSCSAVLTGVECDTRTPRHPLPFRRR